MITEYHRPNTLDEALALLARENPPTLPLGGGTVLNAPSDDEFAVVDLQNLGLDAIESRGSLLDLGATVTLQQLLDTPMPPDLHKAIRHEATHNLRQVGTVAGTLVAADGRSPFAAAMIALDPTLTLLPGGQESPLGDLLHSREYAIRNTQYALRFTYIPKRLITRLTLNTKPTLAYYYVARSPADRPIVCVAAARWPSGRLRVVVGGWGDTPHLALDGPEPGGAAHAVRNITAEAGDTWASAEYRREVAVTLAERALDALSHYA